MSKYQAFQSAKTPFVAWSEKCVSWRGERVDGGPWKWIKIVSVPLENLFPWLRESK